MIRHALIVDTETTGLDPGTSKCIEVACILFDLDQGVPVQSYSSLIRADSNEAEEINHIPPRALEAAPEADLVWQRVNAFASKSDLILAHRAEFDRTFVSRTIANAKPWVCTKFHVEWPHGKPGDHLVHLALAHGLGVSSAHRAMADCDMISRLLSRVHESGTPLVPLIARAMRPRTKVIATVSYDDREKAKAAGFAWDGAARHWWREVPDDEIAMLPFPTRPA